MIFPENTTMIWGLKSRSEKRRKPSGDGSDEF